MSDGGLGEAVAAARAAREAAAREEAERQRAAAVEAQERARQAAEAGQKLADAGRAFAARASRARLPTVRVLIVEGYRRPLFGGSKPPYGERVRGWVIPGGAGNRSTDSGLVPVELFVLQDGRLATGTAIGHSATNWTWHAHDVIRECEPNRADGLIASMAEFLVWKNA